eukprot:360342-Chlamydomonas_euryale.AAC.7
MTLRRPREKHCLLLTCRTPQPLKALLAAYLPNPPAPRKALLAAYLSEALQPPKVLLAAQLLAPRRRQLRGLKIATPRPRQQRPHLGPRPKQRVARARCHVLNVHTCGGENLHTVGCCRARAGSGRSGLVLKWITRTSTGRLRAV